MDILITRHLTLRPLLRVDADDIRDLIAKEPELAAKLPPAMITLISSDDQPAGRFEPSGKILVVIREKLIGWISLNKGEAPVFASNRLGYAAEAMAAVLRHFAPDEVLGSKAHQQQSSHFSA